MNYPHSIRIIRDYDYANSHNYDEHGNIEPNENYVNDLKEMGFPEDRARQALITSRNNLSRATDILLNGDLEENDGRNNNNNNDNNEQANEGNQEEVIENLVQINNDAEMLFSEVMYEDDQNNNDNNNNNNA